MKRITKQEALQYISVEDDYTEQGLEGAAYYTITPSKNSEKAKEGWERVTAAVANYPA